MKVEEARNKVCPFIQRNNATNPTITKQMEALGEIRVIPKFANITCICGDCMAWEYTNTHDNIETKRGWESEPKDKTLMREHGTVGNMFRTYGVEREENIKEGYCSRLVN